MKPDFKRTTLGAMISLNLFGNICLSHAAPTTLSNVTFTMYDPTGAVVGTPDTSVTGNFDLATMTFSLASTTPFFGLKWSTHDGKLYAPGTYVISTADSFGNGCGASFSICAGDGSSLGRPGQNVTFYVPPGKIGGHIKFAWSNTDGIDVFMLWDISGTSLDFGTSAPNVAPDGIRGYKMLDGPFQGFSANFDLTPSPAQNQPPNVGDISIVVAPNTPTNWVPVVTDNDGIVDIPTCTIVSAPSGGVATIQSDCSSGTFDPGSLPLGATVTFTYRADDGNAYNHQSNLGTVTVKVDPNWPVGSDGTMTANGTTATKLDLSTLISDADNNVDYTTLSLSSPSHGTLTHSGSVITYKANLGYSGKDSFTYSVKDATNKGPATGTITVNILPTAPATSSGTFTPGNLASSIGSMTGAGLKPSDVGDDGELAEQCIGGCFDFSIKGVGVGNSATVVLPLTAPIPAGDPFHKKITYRLLTNSGVWKDFDTSSGDTIKSAKPLSLNPTVCPQPGDLAYQKGLNAGDYCLELTIKDGGPNDTDEQADGVVSDPGGIGVGKSVISTIDDPSFGGSIGGGGGTFGLFSLIGLGGLGALRRRMRN